MSKRYQKKDVILSNSRVNYPRAVYLQRLSWGDDLMCLRYHFNKVRIILACFVQKKEKRKMILLRGENNKLKNSVLYFWGTEQEA